MLAKTLIFGFIYFRYLRHAIGRYPVSQRQLTNSPIIDFQLLVWNICLYSRDVKRGNWDSFISWIYLIYCIVGKLIVLNLPEFFNTRIVLSFELKVFDLVVYLLWCRLIWFDLVVYLLYMPGVVACTCNPATLGNWGLQSFDRWVDCVTTCNSAQVYQSE